MGRPRMNASLPEFASEFRDRHGKARIRFRRRGWKTVYAKAEPGTPEFTEQYHEWKRNGRIVVGQKRVASGSFDDVIARFYRSAEWSDLKATTRETYRGELERFRTRFGTRSVATMQAQHVARLMSDMSDKPSAANNLKKRLAQVFDFAVRLGFRTDNPARFVKALKTRKGGHQTWQEAQIAQFEACHPIGTTARLAFDLALYTAQRKSDVRIMGPQHVEGGMIRVRQMKTDKTLLLPIAPQLAASIAATPTSQLAYLVSERGVPFSNDGFGMWFGRQCRKAGLVGFSMHGLRKAASRRMAERGLSNQMIKAITGHSSDSEVARYTREAEQITMAKEVARVMNKANRKKPHLANQK